jgi:sugar phosphate isomerase/epimerase
MKLSTSLNIFWDTGIDIHDGIALCARAGFGALDFNLTDYQRMECPPFLGPEGDEWTRSVRRTADAHGLPFTQLHAPIHRKFVDTEESARFTAMGLESLRVAKLLDVPWVVWEPDTIPGEYGREFRREAIRRNREFFDPFVEEAAKLGVGVCLENCNDNGAHGWNGSSHWIGAEPDDMCELIDSFGSDHIGVCWDTGHAHIQGLDQWDALHVVGDRLKMLHVQDNDSRGDQHLLPFMGGIDWRRLMDALADIDYAGDFTYEVHNSIRTLPNTLKGPMMRYAVSLGNALISREF